MSAKNDLRNLLFKLGIKTANPTIRTFKEIMEDMVDALNQAYGVEDDILMSGSALNAYLEAFGNKEDK